MSQMPGDMGSIILKQASDRRQLERALKGTNMEMPQMRTMEFRDRNGNGIDDRDEATGGPAPMPGGPVMGYPEQRFPQPQPLPGGGLFDRLQPVKPPGLPQPPRMDVGEPVSPPLGSIVARPGIMPGQPDQRMPPRPPGAGSLFDTPDKNDYNRLLANAYQDQYRNAPSPYAAQADYLMNRPVFDRGPRTDDPMFAFRAKDDPFAAMRRQQPVRDEANAAAAAAAKAQQDKLAADEAAAAQAALDATTAEEAAAAKAEQERIAAEKAIAAQAETDRVAAEAAAAQAAETAAAAAAQKEAADAAAATQADAEAESLRIAKEAENQRQADLQARLAAMEGQFGDFNGRFGNFDPAAIQANIAAAQAASAANAATIADTPAVDPDLQSRIDAMQGQLGDFSGRFGGFDPAALRAQIEGLSLGDGAGIGNEGGATAPGFVAPTDRTVQKSREGVVGRNLGGMDKDAIRARIDALQGGTPKPQIDPSSLFSDPGLGGGQKGMPPLRQVKPFDTKVMPGEPQGPVIEGPGFTNPAPAPSGDFQSNVDFMNQMATQNAQVGSDGQAVMPSYSYDPATNEYVRDSSAFGLTGDTAITRYSPEEFQQEFGRTLSKQGSAAPKPKTMPKSAPKVIAGPKPKVIVDPVNPKPKPVPRGKITDRRKAKRGRR